MIVRLGLIVTQASGSVGAVQFASGRAAPTVRMRPTRAAQQTPDQTAHQAAHATAAAAWSALTAAQQFAWKLYALKQVRRNRLGVVRNLTAFQLFVQQNTLRLEIGAPLFSAPPQLGGSGVGTPAFIVFTAGGTYQLTMLCPDSDPTGYYAIYGHRPHSTLRIGRLFKHLIYSAAVDTSMDVDLSPYWTAKMGPMASGEKYWLSARYLGDHSLMSAPLSLTGTVV